LPDLVAGLLVLLLLVPPEVLQVLLSLRIGDVLVVPPNVVEQAVEDLNQVLNATCGLTGLSDVFRLSFRSDWHHFAPMQ
jgi:hypothetical protein